MKQTSIRRTVFHPASNQNEAPDLKFGIIGGKQDNIYVFNVQKLS